MIRGLAVLLLITPWASAQSFAPAPGNPGSTAIHKDSTIIIGWATEATILRGFLNVQFPGLGIAFYGVDADATGIADGLAVVSLGDGGEAILTFESPITNGAGPDFAVFENGFTDHYIELAFVEVSSDGVNYFRFDAVSETPTAIQLTNVSFSDCAYVHNLAGKYRLNYGTPFDLNELTGIPGLNVNQITHVKLIDVVGSINAQYGTLDSQGNIINDPYPTEFDSGGFDLDAIGVINSLTQDISEIVTLEVSIYPNPFIHDLHYFMKDSSSYAIRDVNGQLVEEGVGDDNVSIVLTHLLSGLYFLKITSEKGMVVRKIIKN